MYRLAVEFPLFYGNEREDVHEFIDNYSQASRLNGGDEEKLVLGLPLFLKHHPACGLKLYQRPKMSHFKFCHKN